MTLTTMVTLHGIEIEIVVVDIEKQTHDHPGSSGEIEILSMMYVNLGEFAEWVEDHPDRRPVTTPVLYDFLDKDHAAELEDHWYQEIEDAVGPTR